MIRAAILSAYAQPFQWGRVDCVAAPCRAFESLTGIDPMGSHRGSYSTLAGAYRLVLIHGGFLEFARSRAAAHGLKRSTGKPGEIGVVRLGDRIAPHAGFGVALAMIDEARMWNVKTENGSAALPASYLVECWRA